MDTKNNKTTIVGIVFLLLIILLLVFVVMYSTKTKKEETNPPKEIVVETIELHALNEKILVGEETIIEVSVSPDNAKYEITWSSSDESIATVEDGVVKGISTGTVTITAKINDQVYKECEITIYEEEDKSLEPPVEEDKKEEPKKDTKVSVKGISLNKTSLTLQKGEKQTLTAIITPSNATDKSITWSSSNPDVVQVQKGTVTGISSGTATITATTSNGKKATCTVTVTEIKVTSLTLNQTNIGLKVGQTTTISSTINPSNSTNKTISWKSSNTNVATVTNGTVKGISSGTAIITATIDGISVSVSVKVYANNEDNVKVNFLNTMNNSKLSKVYGNNLCVLLQTKDNKYVLVDTGDKDDKMVSIIYNALKSAQGTDNVVIDYMIISHLDDDHYGNAVSLINKSNITVKNVIVKYEKTAGSETQNVYKNIVKAAANQGTHIITSPNVTASELKSLTGKSVSYTKLSEEYQIKVGDFLNLYFYNVNDIYIGKTCTEGEIIKFKTKSSSDLYKIDGKYVMFDNSSGTYPNVTYQLVDTVTTAGSGFNRKFYAVSSGTRSSCRSNANSIATFAEVKIDGGNNKYVYLPGDLDNNGYDIVPTNGIIGPGTTNLYNPLSFDLTTNTFITRNGNNNC